MHASGSDGNACFTVPPAARRSRMRDRVRPTAGSHALPLLVSQVPKLRELGDVEPVLRIDAPSDAFKLLAGRGPITRVARDVGEAAAEREGIGILRLQSAK